MRHVTLDEAIAAGRISRAWAEDKKRLWGENSAAYHNRVLGDFHSSDEDGLIPLSWIEAAIERWHDWNEQNDSKRWLQFKCLGVDVARSIDGDKTVLAVRHEDVITELRRYAQADTMAVVGHVAGVLNKHGGFAVVDVIGVGGGPFDRLRTELQGAGIQLFGGAAGQNERPQRRARISQFARCSLVELP